MVRIPNIKIPSVRVGSIVPTSNIGTGGATPAPPTPITYLTQWKIVGNSEVHGTEIWSCGEYNPIDGKYHILVQPLGGSIADIALTEPLRKVNDIADTIEFPAALEAFTDADGNQIATTLPNNTILHIQNLYDYAQTTRINISFNNNSQRSAEIKIIQTTAASYCGFSASLQSGKYYTSCLFKNEDAKPNIIYSNSGNSSNVSSSDYQKVSLLQSNVTTLRYSALNIPTGVWEVNDIFFVKDINIFDIDAMFADCTDLKPTSASDFEALFPNLGCIDRINTAIDIIVKDGKLYKYVETEGKALVTRKNIFIQKSFNNGYFDSTGTVFFTALISNDIVKLLYTNRFTISICNKLETRYYAEMRDANMVAMGTYNGAAIFRNYEIEQTENSYKTWLATLGELDLICQLATPTTELVDVPQIAEAESYTCVISQGAKAISWSSFETYSE